MVNHVRTLLLNEAAPDPYGPADEVTDPTFQPVTLTAEVATARALLFGFGCDHYGQCVTLQRILSAARASPVVADALRADDSRESFRDPVVPFPEVAGPGEGAFVVSGPEAFKAAGLGYGSWSVARTGGLWTMLVAGGTPESITPAAYDATRVVVPLPGSTATAVLPDQDGVWVVRVWSAPRHDFTAAAGANPSVVFRPRGAAADATLYDVWLTSPLSWERAAAAAVALSRRIDELRVNA